MVAGKNLAETTTYELRLILTKFDKEHVLAIEYTSNTNAVTATSKFTAP